MDYQQKINMKKGFTLIELLVVISIIALLSSVVVSNLANSREKAKVAKAQLELQQINVGIQYLLDDTGQHPRNLETTPCVQDPETYMNNPHAGLESTNGSFPNWKGPYMDVGLDPWGTNYYFDPDYNCGEETVGCQEKSGWVRAVISFGPNKRSDYGNSDDVVLVLCRG